MELALLTSEVWGGSGFLEWSAGVAHLIVATTMLTGLTLSVHYGLIPRGVWGVKLNGFGRA